MSRTGIMGGTFDPVHLAHLEMARCAMRQMGLDRVLFMPSKNPPHKVGRNILPEEIRAKMVCLAIEDEEGFYYSDFELRREGITYTARTLELLQEQYPEDTFFFIMGGDSLFQFEQWYRPEKILQYAVILAAVRDGVRQEEMLARAAYLSGKYKGDVRIFDMPRMAVSSSMIRGKIARGEEVCEYLPDKVYQLIQRNRYYLEME